MGGGQNLAQDNGATRKLPYSQRIQSRGIRRNPAQSGRIYAHALAAKAEERETTIDRKLFSLFSLSSVASSVMIAVLVGAATITVPDATTAPPYLVIPAIGLVAYIALQMLVAVWNTIKGLEARPYRGATPESVIPKEDDDKAKYVARQLNEIVNTTRQNDWITNRKVEDMKVAHTVLVLSQPNCWQDRDGEA